jgi:hypothetical protein
MIRVCSEDYRKQAIYTGIKFRLVKRRRGGVIGIRFWMKRHL